MTREDLLSLCELFVDRGRRVDGCRLAVDGATADPVVEILRSFRRAEISESEKNALLSLVCDEEDGDFPAETSCVADAFADERSAAFDDDLVG